MPMNEKIMAMMAFLLKRLSHHGAYHVAFQHLIFLTLQMG